MEYREAWAVQEAAHAEVLGGGEERILLVEHPPVITLGRRAGVIRNLVATPEQLAARGVAVVQSDRGGDITFHGPGQLVVYPILRLNDHGLSVGGYVHALERAVTSALAEFKIASRSDPAAVGVWVDSGDGTPAKICAIGVRIKRGASLHGLALNVQPDLSFFDLIVPCGLAGRRVTSIHEMLGSAAPSFDEVKERVVACLVAEINTPRDARASASRASARLA